MATVVINGVAYVRANLVTDLANDLERCAETDRRVAAVTGDDKVRTALDSGANTFEMVSRWVRWLVQ